MRVVYTIQWVRCLSHRDFSRDTLVHESRDFFPFVVVSQEEHHFRDHAFHGAVVSVEHARLQQLQASSVALHLHRTLRALRDVDDDHAAVDEFAKNLDEPRFLRCIARAKRLEDDAPHPVEAAHRFNIFFADAREEREDDDMIVHQEMRLERACGVWATDEVAFVFYVDAGVGQ